MSTTKTPAKRTPKATPTKAAPAAAALTPPAPGQYWPAQKAWYAGIVCQPDGSAWHLLLPKGAKFKAKALAWGAYGTNVAGADGAYDGQANTAAMLAAGSPAALHAQTLGSDIYLPSRAEALLLFATLKDQFEAGYWHWTSTQYGEYTAFGQYFYDGGTYIISKDHERRCRFVRRLPLQSFNPLVLGAA